MKKITHQTENTVDFQFFTLMTRFDEYQEMVNSAKKAGFIDCEFLYFNNKESNEFDGFSGINYAIKNCTSKYLIFCHQDILFNYDTKADLVKKIKELEELDPDWAVIGNAGKDSKGISYSRISDPRNTNNFEGPLPQRVMSLDENFLIINMKNNIGCSKDLKGFHLYGLDLCQNAKFLGYASYVIDFHLFHKSSGNVDKSFYDVQKIYITKIFDFKKSNLFYTTCTKFYVSGSHIKNIIFNNKLMLKVINLFKGVI